MLFLKYKCIKNHIGLNINNWKLFPLKLSKKNLLVAWKQLEKF